jgi:hypothetical protein
MPPAYILGGECGDKPSMRVEKVVPLTTRITQLGRSPLACCKSKPLLAVADVVNHRHGLMKLIDVAIANRIACRKDARQKRASKKSKQLPRHEV